MKTPTSETPWITLQTPKAGKFSGLVSVVYCDTCKAELGIALPCSIPTLVDAMNGFIENHKLHRPELDYLPKPNRSSAADQAREMGIEVGETIEGTEGEGDWAARLKLLWIGKRICVWECTRKTESSEWCAPDEQSNWTLGSRRWFKVKPAINKDSL